MENEDQLEVRLAQAQTVYMYGVALLTAKIALRLAPEQHDAYTQMFDAIGRGLDERLTSDLEPEPAQEMRQRLVALHDEYVSELLDSLDHNGDKGSPVA